MMNISKKQFIPLIAIALMSCAPFAQADIHDERLQLTLIMRQLDMIERSTPSVPVTERQRYHFDYKRLQHDIQRVRNGIQDYLTPKRAQPRDPLELAEQYLLEHVERGGSR